MSSHTKIYLKLSDVLDKKFRIKLKKDSMKFYICLFESKLRLVSKYTVMI